MEFVIILKIILKSMWDISIKQILYKIEYWDINTCNLLTFSIYKKTLIFQTN